MNDGIMYTWDVKVAGSHGYGILYRCARKETAEYLRDWCEAESHNSHLQSVSIFRETRGLESIPFNEYALYSGQYSIDESEVIL